jgi:hypothetical protein
MVPALARLVHADERNLSSGGCRREDLLPGRTTLPLVCAFIQTDTDKHVAYVPRKDLMFDDHLATGAFLAACDLWDAAVP